MEIKLSQAYFTARNSEMPVEVRVDYFRNEKGEIEINEVDWWPDYMTEEEIIEKVEEYEKRK